MELWNKGIDSDNSYFLQRIIKRLDFYNKDNNMPYLKYPTRLVGRIMRKYNFIIIVGEIGIGKSTLAKELSSYNPKEIYIEVQSFNHVMRLVRFRAKKIIELKELKFETGGV